MSRVISTIVTPADTAQNVAYAAPEKTEAAIDGIFVTNASGGTVGYTIYHVDKDVALGAAGDIVATGTVAANAVATPTLPAGGIKLSEGQKVHVRTATAEVLTFRTFGKKAAEGFVFGSPTAS